MSIQINGTTGISGVDGTAGSPAIQGSDTNTGISFGTDEVGINTGGTERVKVDSSGYLRLAGGGIQFNGDTAAANALDDYEEGTFDVTVSMSGSGTVTLNSSYNTMSYTKIGRLVTISGHIRISSVSSPAGNMSIPVPFTVTTGPALSRSSGAVYYFDYSAGTGYYYKLVPGRVVENTAGFDILVYHWENTLIPAANDEIHFSFAYTAA